MFVKSIGIFALISLSFSGCHQYAIKTQPVQANLPETSPALVQDEKIQTLKRNVAIARFSNETNYGKGFFYDGQNDKLAKQAMDILSAKLTETDKFILLERADIEGINNELALSGLSELKIPAEFLIIGSVSEFGRETTSDVGVFTRSKKQTARAKVNIRIVNIHTGQIIYSEEGEGIASTEDATVVGVGTNAGYNSALNDQAISSAISKLVSNIVANMLDKPWKSYLLDFSDGKYIISGGKTQGINPGKIFSVYKNGKKVKNPQTGMEIELPGEMTGKIRVESSLGSSVTDEISICTPVEGALPDQNFDEYYILEN
jgi:curli biogenesis system outer membrane secretion channel CsgG